jgi:hypothetical protein
MSEREDERERAEPWLEDAISRLQVPVQRSPGVVDAVIRAALESGPDFASPRETRFRRRIWTWLTHPEIALSPLAAAAIVVVLVASTLSIQHGLSDDRRTTDAASLVNLHQFVLVAPNAASVSLVGDFNGWSLGATPLERQGSVWSVEVSLPPGRHVYAFVVDGEEWVADASAPRAPEDEFGRPSSVILVPERGT